MKVRRKKGMRGEESWVLFCSKKGIDPWSCLEAILKPSPVGPVYRLLELDIYLGWNPMYFDVVSETEAMPENKPVYKIFKYTLPIAERTHIDLPLGAQILRVDGLDGGLWVWAIVDTTASLERREFALFKTGGDMPDNVAEEYKYVGCGSIYIQQELCLYVFEKLRS